MNAEPGDLLLVLAGDIDVQKTKELVAMGIAIRSQCKHCIGYHARNLVRLGGTREEVADVLAMAAYMGGGPAINYGAMALQAFDQFSEVPVS